MYLYKIELERRLHAANSSILHLIAPCTVPTLVIICACLRKSPSLILHKGLSVICYRSSASWFKKPTSPSLSSLSHFPGFLSQHHEITIIVEQYVMWCHMIIPG